MIDFAGLFGPISDPVLVLEGESVIYRNVAAERLFPQLAEKDAAALLPSSAMEHESLPFTGEAAIGGERHAMHVSSFSGYRIVTLVRYKDNHGGESGKGAFTAIGEELADHLSVLKMASGLALPYLENTGDEKLQIYASMIYHSYYAIKHLNDNVEVLADALCGGGTAICTSFDLAELCRDIVDTVKVVAPPSCPVITVSGCETMRTFYADKSMLTRLVLNLLSNSIKKTDESGGITLAVSETSTHTIIAVSDTGTGITPQEQRSIWNMSGEQRSLTGVTDGAGLGMTVVQHIARLHGGSAVIESRKDEMTTVTVSLPKREPESSVFNNRIDVYEDSLMQQVLAELSGIIEIKHYSQRLMD